MKYVLIVLCVFLAVLPARAEKIAIAVLDLDAKGEGLSQGVADVLTETVRFEFAKQESIDLVAREKMRELAKEKAFQLTGCTDVACAVQIGKALNVQKMVMGSVTKLGKRYTLILRMVDVEKENVECSDKKEAGGQVDSLDSYVPEIVGCLSICAQVQRAREIVLLKQNDADIHFLLGRKLKRYGSYLKNDEQKEKYLEAGQEFVKVVKQKPNFAEAYYEIGEVFIELKDESLAVGAFREAIKLKPELLDAHNALGLLLANQGKFDEAEKEYREVIKLYPNDAEARYGLGNIFRVQEKYVDAVKEFREAIRLKPDDAESYGGLGVTLYKQGKYKEAERAHREALKLKPGLVVEYKMLALCLDAQGNRTEARVYWEKALGVEKDPAWIESISKRLEQPD